MDTRDPDASIYTVTGQRFWPLDPRPEEVNIVDIAHALSNVCRFTGHTREFYSVAQHSVLVSRLLPPELKLWGLLHDASEAYISDISRPVKYQKEMVAYRDIEHHLISVIAEAFKLPFPEPLEVKTADNTLLVTEKRDLFPQAGEFSKRHTDGALPMGYRITPWTPAMAKDRFLREYRELTGQMPIQFDTQFCTIGGCCGCSDEEALAARSTIRIAEDFANRPEV